MFVTSDGTTKIAAACAGTIEQPQQADGDCRQAKTDNAFDEAGQQEGAGRDGQNYG